MRDLVRQITSAYMSTRLEGQEGGTVLFSGQEPDTKQPVWIRILPRLLGDDPKIAAQFRGLAQTIRQLNHPSIASIRAVGEKAGLPFIVTRAVEKAQPLAARLDQPWAVDAAADMVMQAGAALEYAYKKGLVHGSLSPKEILVQENGRVQVTGFGVNGFLELLGVQLKQAASPYLAPERLAGKSADARADVFALAAILYGLLAKRQPQVVQGRVLPPGRFNLEVPPEMDRIIVKALAPNPAERFPDVKSFLLALGAVTLIPAQAKMQALSATRRCPKCGTHNQAGRFCRKCGTPLGLPAPAAEAAGVQPSTGPASRPADGTAGSIQSDRGIPGEETVLAKPATILAVDSAIPFPDPLPMPQVHLEELWAELAREVQGAMPKPPPMPVIDWAEAAPAVPQAQTIETGNKTPSAGQA